MKYIFKQIDNISGRLAETTIEFHADSLSDILEQFEMFLRGSGFHTSGTLDFVPDEEYYGYTTPKFECAEENDEENEQPHEWTRTIRGIRDDGEMLDLDGFCHRCGLTKNQLGDNICYDINCGLKGK